MKRVVALKFEHVSFDHIFSRVYLSAPFIRQVAKVVVGYEALFLCVQILKAVKLILEGNFHFQRF